MGKYVRIVEKRCQLLHSKYQLNEEYSRLLEGFLSSGDFAWAVRRYLSFFQEKGIPSLDRTSINDSREFVISAATSTAAGSLHNLLCYVRQFHIFLKDSGEKAPDCISPCLHIPLPEHQTLSLFFFANIRKRNRKKI